MKKCIIVCWGEVKKQRANYFNKLSNYISLLIWPVIVFLTTYFTYRSFDISVLNNYGIDTQSSLMAFLVTGALGYNCFWCMVQSALFMLNERQNGTLEIVFLSPANRLAVMYGRALGGIFQSIWMFLLFALMIIFITNGITVEMLFRIPLALIVLIVSSTIWGGFINSVFIISRDITFWFTLSDEPMYLLSGAKVPVEAFPLWSQVLAAIFPLTYCLYIIRALFTGKDDLINPVIIVGLVTSLALLILITYVILYFAEKRNRRTGNLQLY
ncbi:MAG TPA: ABC transporter permease [Ignavibacteriales bacterium]|nr:ABC transporter permease [Ignavibacteriales bacterium]